MNIKKIEENKRIASEFYHAFGIEKDADKCSRYLGDTYIQHNPYIQDGPEHFLRFVRFRREHYPEARSNVMMTIADEDKVMFHVHSVLTPGEPGRNIVDTFRVRDGKVVEHWDVIQNIEVLKYPPLTDNGMFNTLGDAILKDPDRTEENKRIVTAFYEAFGLDKDAEKCRQFMGDTYIQHNPHVQDGPEHFLRFVQFRKEHFPEAKSVIRITVAQGNLVGLHVHSVLTPGEPGRNIVDIFRVEDGKVVEHWDAIQNIEVLKYPPVNGHGLY